MPKHVSKSPDTKHVYIDVIIFMATLLVANALWKWMISGDEAGVGAVMFLGWDVTALFDAYARHIAAVVYAAVHYFRDTLYMVNETTMRFVDGGGTHIVWSCTPIKQMFIWVCLILTTPNYKLLTFNSKTSLHFTLSTLNWNKLWFIPLGLVFIHFVNLARICAITAFMEFHSGWFDLLHTYIFKYLFYGLMFLFWILYVEKVRK